MVSRGLERLRYSVRSMTLGLIFLPTRGGLCQPIRDDPIDSRIETHTTVAATDLNILGPMILLHFSADSPVNNPIAFTVDRRQRNGCRLIVWISILPMFKPSCLTDVQIPFLGTP